MHAKEVSLIALIQGEKQFEVPLFQRTYSWQNKQYVALWHDVHEQSQGDSTDYSHFLGSVVLAPSPKNSAADLPCYLVIDGQQRLTTLMLLLAAIRDHVRSVDAVAAERINEQ